MFSLSGWRAVFMTLFSAGLLLTMTAGPASAETVLTACTGTCGAYSVHDGNSTQDVTCIDRTKDPNELYQIQVQPPKVYGPTAAMTTVQWRFQIQDKGFIGPSHWKTISTSAYQTATASNSVPAKAGHGLTSGTWSFIHIGQGSVFEGYRVLVEMNWWNNSGVIGRVKIKYDWYKQVRRDGSHSTVIQTDCKGAQHD